MKIKKRLDPVLLKMACSWSMKAYNDENRDAIKIENKWTSMTAYVVKRKSIDVIVFRGTQQARDWIFNASAIPVPYAGRLAHGGFAMAHRSIWKKILPHIDWKKRTLVCGHSLGGALSEITAAILERSGHQNVNLVTFGKPNVWFKGSKRRMILDNQISVVNGSDSVAKIPRALYGPSKSQTMLYFSNTGFDCIDPSRDTRRADRGNLKDGISDHFMDGYKKRLDAYLEANQ